MLYASADGARFILVVSPVFLPALFCIETTFVREDSPTILR